MVALQTAGYMAEMAKLEGAQQFGQLKKRRCLLAFYHPLIIILRVTKARPTINSKSSIVLRIDAI